MAHVLPAGDDAPPALRFYINRMIWKVHIGLTLMCGIITMPTQDDSFLKTVPNGSWGGKHIQLVVIESGATVEYDCASGTIDEPLLLDKDGNFEACGIHVFERGGPRRLGEPPPKRHPAQYQGWTDGSQMSLTVNLLDTGEVVGSFSLGLSRPPQIEKCL